MNAHRGNKAFQYNWITFPFSSALWTRWSEFCQSLPTLVCSQANLTVIRLLDEPSKSLPVVRCAEQVWKYCVKTSLPWCPSTRIISLSTKLNSQNHSTSCLALQIHLLATCKIMDITQLSTCNYNIVNDNHSNLTHCSLVKHYLLYKSTLHEYFRITSFIYFMICA